MLKAEKSRYIVHKCHNTYIWLQVLEGEDEGIRLSIPVYSDRYSNDMVDRISNLNKGDLIEAVLLSENVESPNWFINSMSVEYKL